MQKYSNILLWVCRLLAAIIMLQTLYFKFSAAEESVYIFSQLGIEPWGRIGSGIVELIAALLILYPPLTVYGAVLALGTMSGAIAAHIFKLGISVQGDGGQLFIYALLVFMCSLVLLVKYWPQLKMQVLVKLVKR
jgi:uncharacterized membrane protein YphA (DoxX/SURF4 family)